MESNPEMSGDADFRNPDIRQNRRGFFMPNFSTGNDAPLDFQSCGPFIASKN
jgi:hypothetical protein